MSFSRFHVWAVVLLSANMQNRIVNRFRRRAEAEDCLRLLRRSKPSKSYEIMYAPPDECLAGPLEKPLFDADSNCTPAVSESSKSMEIVWYQPEYRKPEEVKPVLGVYLVDGELSTASVSLGGSGLWWVVNDCESIDPPLWWTEIPLPLAG